MKQLVVVLMLAVFLTAAPYPGVPLARTTTTL